MSERFDPLNAAYNDVFFDVYRYLLALNHCQDKVVADIGCGKGLGTYLISLVASKVMAVDYNLEALSYIDNFPTKCEIDKLCLNLELYRPPKAEVYVALEVLEHLKNPEFFLKNANCEKIYFSVPKNSLAVSDWHKFDFKTQEDVEKLLKPYFQIQELTLLNDLWFCGYGIKI
jgi:2-polyprenyl-3-methyl-5-hydroxy-6-metoxy-1,4-benzoquinol methylase